jgi:hypothetical protein
MQFCPGRLQRHLCAPVTGSLNHSIHRGLNICRTEKFVQSLDCLRICNGKIYPGFMF